MFFKPVEGKAFAEAAEDAQTILRNVALKLHGDTELPIVSEGLIRRAVVHTPPGFDPQKPFPVLVTADSFTVNKVEPRPFGLSSLTGMSRTNGLDAMADANGIVTLHLFHVPVRSAPGVHVASWQSEGAGILTPNAPLNKGRPKYDDARGYGVDAARALAGKMNVESLNFAAFAEGAEFQPNLMSAIDRVGIAPMKSAAFVSGTSFGHEMPIPRGLQYVTIVHGTGDPNFPLEGGPGKITKILPWLGHAHVENSSVDGLWRNVHAAMGDKPHPWSMDGEVPWWYSKLQIPTTGFSFSANPIPGGTERIWRYPKGEELSFVTIDGMGSTWPGRSFGPEHESQVSRFNGNRSDFNINNRVAEMILRKEISRTLAATA
jgi:poly(3-hydroxybutyrate) depolymerase